LQAPKRILICPLDWGLGHAARCIPLIHELLAAGFEVVIAADHQPFELLSIEFPKLERLRFPSYRISYRFSMPVNMLLSIPEILMGIRKENRLLKQLIFDCKIDLVISDNRFGLWSDKIPCVFITHQLMIKCPPYLRFMEGILHRINLFFIKKYNQCWVPDFPGENNLSGELSHKFPLAPNTFFIGPLSRFSSLVPEKKTDEKFDILVILSGPEPQRTRFENILLPQLSSFTNYKIVFIRGLPSEHSMINAPAHIQIYSHLASHDLFSMIMGAALIICRPGYSSIMDISVMGKNAILVPTPGQTEQEYLAEELKKNKMAYSIAQEKFDLGIALQEVKNYKGIPMMKNEGEVNTDKVIPLINELLYPNPSTHDHAGLRSGGLNDK
jgi:uncharacterized protein (TIGR00661 family)